MNTAHAAPVRGDRKRPPGPRSRATKRERAREREIRDAVEFAAFGLRERADVVDAIIYELVLLEFHRPFLCARLT